MNWDGYAIWWTTESDCRRTGSFLEGKVPKYLRDQYQDRWGRNGRGRLWCADGFPTDCPVDAEWEKQAKSMGLEAFSRAGIVIKQQDIKTVQRFYGFVTDERLNLLASCKA